MKTAGTRIVGKKKPTPDKWPSKPVVLQLRGSAEFKTWLEGLADFDATTVSEMAERAFATYARQIGYTQARPRR